MSDDQRKWFQLAFVIGLVSTVIGGVAAMKKSRDPEAATAKLETAANCVGFFSRVLGFIGVGQGVTVTGALSVGSLFVLDIAALCGLRRQTTLQTAVTMFGHGTYAAVQIGSFAFSIPPPSKQAPA